MKQTVVCDVTISLWLQHEKGGIMINFKINGISVKAQEGETILQVARREDIYIPTMCYLAKATPNASCRMCVVEAKDVMDLYLVVIHHRQRVRRLQLIHRHFTKSDKIL